MGWEKPLRSYKIIVFTRYQTLLDALAEYFGNMEGVTIVNLLQMDESLAEKLIDAYSIDIAFIEQESVDSTLAPTASTASIMPFVL